MNKKILLGFGSIAAIVAPIAAVVSCDSDSDAKKELDKVKSTYTSTLTKAQLVTALAGSTGEATSDKQKGKDVNANTTGDKVASILGVTTLIEKNIIEDIVGLTYKVEDSSKLATDGILKLRVDTIDKDTKTASKIITIKASDAS